MPNLITSSCRPRMGRQGYNNARELAEDIGYPHSRVRNGIGGSDVVSWATVYAIARALQSDDESLNDVVRDIVANNEGVPDLPPVQPPKDPKGPPSRQDSEGEKTGPKRLQDRAA